MANESFVLSPKVLKADIIDTQSHVVPMNRQRSFGDIITPQKLVKDIKTALDQDILGFSVNFTQNKASESKTEFANKPMVKAKSFKSQRQERPVYYTKSNEKHNDKFNPFY